VPTGKAKDTVAVGAQPYIPAMTAAVGERTPVVRIPRSYQVWLTGALVSQVGDAALYFALGWAASAHGGPAAGLVLSSINLPRTVLLLIGGAVGDRLGARRIMITGDATMLVVAAVLAAVSWHWGTPLALLVTAGLIIGTVDAFYLPSSGSMPRQLVDDVCLPRALALRQSGSQLVSMIGGPVGGALVAFAGFAAASVTDSVSFAVVLAALIAIRPRFTPPETPRRNVLREAADGFRVAWRTPGLAAVLLLVAGVAGFVIPVNSLLVPLISRQHHWTAAVAGLIVGAQAAGGIVVSLIVARRGAVSRPGAAAALGLAAVAAGELVIGLAHVKMLAIAGAVVMGLGTGTFVCNLGPVLMGTSPRSHLARIQALLSLAQSGALLVFNNVLGAVAHVASAAAATLTCAAIVTVCALVAFVVPGIRNASTPARSPSS
jgi:MFS family permease